MPGYLRFPTLRGETIVFACEDDLWTVPASGGLARRLTSGRGESVRPALSPDGTWLAFTGTEEGEPEVYVMPAAGGPARRLTFLGSLARVCGWTPDGEEVLFSSAAAGAFDSPSELWAVPREGGAPRRLGLGPADDLAFGPDGARVLGRNKRDPAFWKRYRGGTAGELWIERGGKGDFRRIAKTGGNVAWPMWAGGRVFFVSDHEGVGNLYSCAPSGAGLRRHTSHKEFYVRNPASDGARIVYQLGGALRLCDPASGGDVALEVELNSPRTQRARRFVSAAAHLEDYELHPEGHSLVVAFRGRLASMGNWDGPAVLHGASEGVRYRLPRWLKDGKRVVVVSDQGGEESLEVQTVSPGGLQAPRRIAGLDIGRAVSLTVSPKADQVLLSNHRCELIWVDLEKGTQRRVDRSAHGPIRGEAWSPDGKWAAYSIHVSPSRCAIRLWNVETGKTADATRPVLRDVGPAFDPGGKYLYFLSTRDFDPVYGSVQFELGFPRGVRPHLLTLRADEPSPFVGRPQPLKKAPPKDAKKEGEKKEPEFSIDLEGLPERVIAFPVAEGRYLRVMGMKGKVLFSSEPVHGSLGRTFFPGAPEARATLEAWDLEGRESKTIMERISDFDLSRDGSTMAVQSGRRLRVSAAGEAPDASAGDAPGRKSGWVDLSRPRASLDPASEWRQMYADAWRLQRDLFWNPALKAPDWERVYRRYAPLLDLVASRSEFTDVLWEMQGELGTSHAYAFGGDYRREPRFDQGHLGADLAWDPKRKAWTVRGVVAGDCWDRDADSPLRAPGVRVGPGDELLAVDGRGLGEAFSPAQALVHRAGREVELTVRSPKGEPRAVTVRALRDEQPARYRAWVERNRRTVHEATGGRCGYIHVPNMGPTGYAEFHRAFLAEVERDALIIDVRNNGGGHVSSLILEKLSRKRIGYGASRYFGLEPYPQDSPAGPLVALTDEWAGSDGDIFSHAFQRLKLGPLIGKRTWGGVIGIHPRFPLADGGVTTQPEYAFWFDDAGWGIENRGAVPDIEVDIRPQDHAAGKDPQLERGLAEVKRRLKAFKPKRPRIALPAEKGPTIGVSR